jgi:hypothetical protein
MQVPVIKSLYKPSVQGVGVVDVPEQENPTGHVNGDIVPAGQNEPALHAVLYWGVGQ